MRDTEHEGGRFRARTGGWRASLAAFKRTRKEALTKRLDPSKRRHWVRVVHMGTVCVCAGGDTRTRQVGSQKNLGCVASIDGLAECSLGEGRVSVHRTHASLRERR